jgi:hypothetical protein
VFGVEIAGAVDDGWVLPLGVFSKVLNRLGGNALGLFGRDGRAVLEHGSESTKPGETTGAKGAEQLIQNAGTLCSVRLPEHLRDHLSKRRCLVGAEGIAKAARERLAGQLWCDFLEVLFDAGRRRGSRGSTVLLQHAAELI